jgi:hypothetical protein
VLPGPHEGRSATRNLPSRPSYERAPVEVAAHLPTLPHRAEYRRMRCEQERRWRGTRRGGDRGSVSGPSGVSDPSERYGAQVDQQGLRRNRLLSRWKTGVCPPCADELAEKAGIRYHSQHLEATTGLISHGTAKAPWAMIGRPHGRSPETGWMSSGSRPSAFQAFP